MPDTLFPLLLTIALIALSGGLGIWPITKIIQMNEARHELKQGSAGYLRSLSGWFVVVLWLVVTWFVATILGDWWATADLEGAIARSARRLELIFHILATLGND